MGTTTINTGAATTASPSARSTARRTSTPAPATTPSTSAARPASGSDAAPSAPADATLQVHEPATATATRSRRALTVDGGAGFDQVDVDDTADNARRRRHADERRCSRASSPPAARWTTAGSSGSTSTSATRRRQRSRHALHDREHARAPPYTAVHGRPARTRRHEHRLAAPAPTRQRRDDLRPDARSTPAPATTSSASAATPRARPTRRDPTASTLDVILNALPRPRRRRRRRHASRPTTAATRRRTPARSRPAQLTGLGMTLGDPVRLASSTSRSRSARGDDTFFVDVDAGRQRPDAPHGQRGAAAAEPVQRRRPHRLDRRPDDVDLGDGNDVVRVNYGEPDSARRHPDVPERHRRHARRCTARTAATSTRSASPARLTGRPTDADRR